ncbi:Speckle-type POZ protein like [Argiope bruennichi]|uniref:Speckle-type POZ protein like n=1 Tax=Argiope bruennichi TaxID=94029 RepID=A0A8T0FEJ9_ARGBR|nr:Speckle-type POZ protein like [Argiope bruennichi]
MAKEVDGEPNGCTFLWKIENINHCWLEMKEPIESPPFIADALEGTKWSLRLYPMGLTDKNYVCFDILRKRKCNGPEDIRINFQLVALDKDELYLTERTATKCDFKKSVGKGYPTFESREKIFITEREAFLPDDTLTLQCTIWNEGQKPVNPKYLYARTVFKVNRRSFVWKIDNFSALTSGMNNKFKDDLIEFDFDIKEGLDLEKKLVVKNISYDESLKYISFTVNVIDSEKKKKILGSQEYFADDLKEGVLPTLLNLKTLLENKRLYFPDDVLHLDCEYTYSNGDILFEHCGSRIIFQNKKNDGTECSSENNINQKESLNAAELVKDLKSICNNAIFSDSELRTSTQTFPTHMAILSARSPVFKSMFSHDMKEKNRRHVDITDLDDETIHQMLLYIYMNSVEAQQLESVSKLYVAADKYQILSLKSKCASFLKENLCPTKACEVLLLADLHSDKDLKSFVNDYILKHDKEVFGSQEWKDFMDTNLKLAADIMYSKVYPC